MVVSLESINYPFSEGKENKSDRIVSLENVSITLHTLKVCFGTKITINIVAYCHDFHIIKKIFLIHEMQKMQVEL